MLALMLPVLMGIGSIVVSIGNWYVLKKNLQTLVDAGALAGATGFNACFQDPMATNAAIEQKALEYAGDPTRDPSTRNLLAEDHGDVHVVLNSSQYWAQANGTDPALPSPGYGLDYSLPAVDGVGAPAADSTPCSTKFLDVKATEHRAPLLWRWLPLFPSPKARARVEIREVEGLNGTLPWGVPEQNPVRVAALIVNEDLAASNVNSVRGAVSLNRQTLPPGDPLQQWSVWRGDALSVNLNGSSNFGVIILTSRDPDVSLSGSLSAICSQNPAQTRCYSGGTSSSGLSFIHAYSDASPPVEVRDVRLTSLTCTTDLSAPYYLLDGGCSVQLSAVVDFGNGGGNPVGGTTCGSVSASPGGGMTWSAGGIGGAYGTWTTNFSLNTGSGRTVVSLTAQYKNPAQPGCGNRLSTTFPKVAAPYVSNNASGPVEYLEVRNLDNGLLGNSINGGPDLNLGFTVGLTPPLVVTSSWNEPPVYLRITTNSSQTQAVDCDGSGISGPAGNHSNFRNEIEDGCYVFYRINNRNGSCSGFSTGNLPPSSIVSDPYPDCIVTQTGVSSGQIRQALESRFGGNPCKTLNNWPSSAGAPFPDASDPRYVVLFIVDTGSFSGSGNQIYPVRKFGGFYLTGGDGLGCPGDDPPPAGTRQASAWGHFVKIEVINPDATPSETLCAFEQVGVCTALLVD